MEIYQAIILALIEGVTEYLPISSTGHLIIASKLMTVENQEFVTQFNIIVQLGAILSVLVIYWRRFISPVQFYLKIAVAFLPAAILGLLVKSKIDSLLDSVSVVATALIVGGFVLIILDRKKKPLNELTSSQEPLNNGGSIESLTLYQAFAIGLAQCLAFVPGVSRAAATIIGGLGLGLSRTAAAEFSFFLAVPTLAGATFIKFLKIWPAITADQIQVLVLGNIISFIVGLIAIKTFIVILTKYSFQMFGYYRIALGLLVFLFVV